RAVIFGKQQPLFGLTSAQAQDVILQRMQQRIVIQLFGIEAYFLALEAEQRIEKVSALFAEARQQRVANLQIPVLGGAFRLPRQFPDVTDVAPGLAARVERTDHHVNMSRQTL